LAKLRDIDGEQTGTATTISVGLSEDGLILGSLPYMAPEQVEGKPVDGRADLFALGVVLYEMLTGEPPFRGTSKASLMVAILSEEPVPPRARQPLTPALLDRTIKRCLAKAPEDRWQNAADLAAELTYVLETLHERGPSVSPSKHRRIGSVMITLTALTVGAVLASIGLLAWMPARLQ